MNAGIEMKDINHKSKDFLQSKWRSKLKCRNGSHQCNKPLEKLLHIPRQSLLP